MTKLVSKSLSLMPVAVVPVSLFVHVLLFEGVGVFFTIRQPMPIEARILEWTVTTTHVEVPARNISDCFLVLLYQPVFQVALVNHAL